MAFLTVESAAVSDSLACLWDPFSPTGLPHPALMLRICVWSYCSLLCCVWLMSLGGLSFFEGKRRWGRAVCVERLEGGKRGETFDRKNFKKIRRVQLGPVWGISQLSKGWQTFLQRAGEI